MAVLITGGTGFVGSWLARNLVERGEKVVIYDLYLRNEAIRDIIDEVKVVKGDVLDLGNLIAAIKAEGVDRIIHTASYLGVESQQRPPMAVKATCEGTANVLEASRLMDVGRVVFTSTQSVYGVTPPGEVVSEDHPTNPNTVYGATKRLCEWLGLNYRANYGLDFIAIRFPTIFGPTKLGRGWQVPITDIVENPVMGRPVVIRSGGDVKREWVYVKDMANTVVNACFVDSHEHKIFNLGSGQIYTHFEVAEVVKRHVPDALFQIEKGPDPLFGGIGGPLDCTRAMEELGHEITYPFEKAIEEWIRAVSSGRRTEPGDYLTAPVAIPTLESNGGR